MDDLVFARLRTFGIYNHALTRWIFTAGWQGDSSEQCKSILRKNRTKYCLRTSSAFKVGKTALGNHGVADGLVDKLPFNLFVCLLAFGVLLGC